MTASVPCFAARPSVYGSLLLAAAVVLPATVLGQSPGTEKQAFPELYQMYYDGGLLEYCNLVTPLASKGFRAMRADLLARDRPTDEQHRQTRIAAATAIDTEYLDHGLGGQRLWCKTEGKAAFDRFEAYGRDRQ